MASPTDKMNLARRHLERVQLAWDDPTDWADLASYGLYALEAAVDAVLLFLIGRSGQHTGIGPTQRSNCLPNMDLMMSPNSFAISMKCESVKRMETS